LRHGLAIAKRHFKLIPNFYTIDATAINVGRIQEVVIRGDNVDALLVDAFGVQSAVQK
jgi:hypothetical protein